MKGTLSESASEFLRKLVFRQAAIVLDDKKDYLLQARLGPVLERAGVGSWDELVTRLSDGSATALRQKVVEALTTNETSFFRDLHPFATLRDQVLPQLAVDRAATKTLCIWSAAASSGQEIYSIAMILREQGTRWAGWNLRLFGSDLSSEILARAKEGRYSQIEVNRGLPAPLLVRYFDNVGTEWQVKEELRRMVDFRNINLIDPWPAMPPMDVVFLRNVLIYFDMPTRKRILDKVAAVMRPGSFLFLGGVETTLNLSERYEELQVGKTVLYKLVR